MTNFSNSIENVIKKIYKVRGEKIMLDRDLAQLYGVGTNQLREAVSKNMTRFPEDFMFEMTPGELEIWRSQFESINSEEMGSACSPFCFTVRGIVMLPSVLNSEIAKKMSIQLFRLYVEMNKASNNHFVTQPDSFPFFT
jgi:hypothetical protein